MGRIQLGLDPNGELKSISLINITHPSLEEALDKTNLRITNPREILDNKITNESHRHGMVETIFSPMDIHEHPWSLKRKITSASIEATSLTPHQIHAHMRNLLNQLVSLTLPHTRSSTPSCFLFIKTLKWWLQMHMFIINFANLVGMNLERGTRRLVLERKPLHQLEIQFEGFSRTSFCPKTSTFRR